MAKTANSTPVPSRRRPASGGPVTRAIKTIREGQPRRGFLRGLLSLPLISGGITLIGAPSAVADPVTRETLFAYSEWLRVERNRVHDELFPNEEPRLRQYSAFPQTLATDNPFHVPPRPDLHAGALPASTRAALVLSTVGCDWLEGGL